MPEKLKIVAVIGGGPAGLSAAISAAKIIKQSNLKAKVIVLEQKESAGKTILRTGNGRCNLSNTAVAFSSKKNYINHSFVKTVQRKTQETIRKNKIFKSDQKQASLMFFEDCGLVWKTEPNGMMFPYSNQAKTVQKILLNRANTLNVELFTKWNVDEINLLGKKFTICSNQGKLLADQIIITTGGGTTTLLNKKVKTKGIFKVLGPIITKEKIPKSCDGVRAQAKVSLFTGQNKVFEEEGQVLFRKYGVSGIVIFNATRFLKQGQLQKLILDLVPDKTEEELSDYFRSLKNTYGLQEMLMGLLPLELYSLIRDSFKNCNLEFNESNLAYTIKNICLTAQSIGESKQCQVTRGGIDISEIDENTMEILELPGVFVAGEIIDVDGACGGFNLDWAWTSGILAGISAAKELHD